MVFQDVAVGVHNLDDVKRRDQLAASREGSKAVCDLLQGQIRGA